MTLSLLLLLVTGGIAGIVIILHLLGLSRPCVFTDEPAVRRVWQAEYPDTQILSIVQSRNRHFALVDSRAGLGIVWPMGADGAARLLLGVEVRRTKSGLILSLPDYTAPEISLWLTPDEAQDWLRRIKEAP
ncbi:hypothetical protein ACSSNL_00880 [Thalassobius sp. S69A]|uniref:hypothetical protein n=1 Tax=unclassified Thalassovita TaxID=2619711 RepID=UPI003C7E4A4B